MQYFGVLLTIIIFCALSINSCYALSRTEITHLLMRTSYGIQTNQVSTLLQLDRKQAIELILTKIRTEHYIDPPKWLGEQAISKNKNLSKEDRKKINKIRRERSIDLKAWWFKEMLSTPSPFTEQMTLFWHNHFTSSLRKVKSPKLMYLQNTLLRKHALGNFRDLLHAITEDPAMILYLDNQSNRKGKPNENYARELLELFTLGEGNYSEDDIKEAARAFTGYQINRRTGEFFINFRQHDFSEKTFMNRTGKFIGEDIVDIILEKPKVARYISEKIARKFISAPSERLLADVANTFFNSSYEIMPLIRNIINSDEFWNENNRGTMIKSPVELILGTLRTLGFQPSEYRPLVQGSRRMGQDIFDPPNVKGWPGGKQWITTNTFLARKSVLIKFIKGAQKAHQMMNRMSMQTMDKMHMQVKLPPMEHLNEYGLATKPVFDMSNKRNIRNFLTSLIHEPSYQLK